ncbi:MAG TPA: recombinase RecA [Methanofastidiosum sp.]|nr:recombinase RecA [Methanofastidiosum sp.]
MSKDRLKKIVTSLQKAFGEETVVTLNVKPQKVEVISTGSILIDNVIGVGGFPRGRIIELFGEEGSGKSTIALLTVAELQRKGGIAGYVDMENALDGEYAQKLGVDVSSLLISQPSSGEEGLAVAEKMLEEGVDFVVVDSVAALVPKAELEGEMGAPNIALQARLLSQALRRLSTKVSRSNACLVFINQIREIPGVIFGNTETTPGGRALKFYASVRLRVKRKTAVKDEKGVIIGDVVEIKVVKNKVAFPFRSCVLKIIWGEGYDESEGLVNIAVERGLVKNPKPGVYIVFDKELKGKEELVEFFKTNPDAVLKLFTETSKDNVEIKNEVNSHS